MEKNDRTTIGICPVCGTGHVIEMEQGFACDNKSCGFLIHKEIKRTPISAEVARKIITEGRSDVMKFYNAGNSPFHARIILKEGAVCVEFDNVFLKGRCPICGGRVQVTEKGYNCENRVNRTANGKECPFHMNKRLCNRELSKEEVERFLDGKTDILDGFTSSAGNEFSGFLELNEAGYARTCSKVSFCPKCGGTILAGPKGFNCSKFKTEGCWMKLPRRIGGHKLTMEDVRQLCESDNHTTEPVDIRLNNGEVVKRRLTLDENYETITI